MLAQPGRCFVLVLVVTAFAFSGDLSYYLQEKWSENDKEIRVVDIDGDGVDEIVSRPWHRELDILDWRLSTFLLSTYLSAQPNSYVDVVPSFYRNSVYLYWPAVSNDSIVYHVALRGDARDRYGRSCEKEIIIFLRHPDTNPTDFARQSISYFGTFHNADNDTLALFRIHTTYDRKGYRGLVAYNLRTFEPVWKVYFGPRANQSVICDIDNDNADEIIIGTSAPYNGISFNNIPDSSAYVICVDDDGTLKWTFNAGPYFTSSRATIFNLPGGEKQLFVHRYGGAGNEQLEQDAIWMLDLQTGRVIEQKSTSFITEIGSISRPDFCNDFNGDGVDEAVVGMQNGCVRMFDRSLVEIISSPYFKGPVSVEAVADFDGDGVAEIAAYVMGQKLVILSSELQLLCEYDLSSVLLSAVSVVRTEQGSKLLLSYRDGDKKIDKLFELKHTRFALPLVSKKVSAVFLIGAIVLSLAALFFILRQRKKYHELVERVINSPRIRNQIVIVSEKGMIGNAGAAWRNLLGLGGDQDADIPLLEQHIFRFKEKQLTKLLAGRQQRFDFEINKDEKVNTYRIEHLPLTSAKGKILYLHENDEDLYVKHLKLWAPTAQRLAHSIKNPLTTVSLNLDDVKKTLQNSDRAHDKEAVENIQDIFDQIKRIEQMCNDFMHFAKFEKPQLAPTAINRLIVEWVNEWRPHKKSIELHFDLQEDLPDALVDEGYLHEACQHAFANALESLNGKGHITISSQRVERYRQSGEAATFIQLSFHDTGCGIPARYLENIKKPYFTTKANGSGLGLSVVGKNMDMMNGDYKIVSNEGMGTTLLLFLPVVG